jgi:hypothetical protein
MGYTHFNNINVSMQYFTFELIEAPKELHAFVTSFWKYCNKRMSIGIKQLPGIAQEEMDCIFGDADKSEVYINSVSVFNNSW